MISKSDLTRLAPAEKRDVMRALLRSTLAAPRSFPLSYAQEQLWFMDQLQPLSPLYNIPLYVPFIGPLDVQALKRAIAALTRRHDMLRVHFCMLDEAPVQIVEPEVAVELPIEDISLLPPDQRDEAFGERLNAEVQTPFDLSVACVRYKLFRTGPVSHLLSATMHHIVTDAWSLGVFVSELRAFYEAFRIGQHTAAVAPVQLEYTDYVQWQRATLRGLRLSKLVSYWAAQLSGAPHVLRLATDHPRPRDQTFNGTVAGFVFSDELSEALIALSGRHHVTLFMLLLACYYALLYRYTGQEDIIVGAPVANRAHRELEPVIGIFVNTLILRVKLQEHETFAELLRDVQLMCLDAFEHQALPFEKLVDALNVERVPGYPPLYQVVFNFQNASLIESDNPSAEGETMQKGDFPFVHSNTAKVDLNLTVTQNRSTVSGGIEYNTDLFERSSIDEMIAHFEAVARTVVADSSVALLEIPLSTAGGARDAPRAPATTQCASVRESVIEYGKFSFELTDD